MKKIKLFFCAIRILPILPIVKWSDKLFMADLKRWKSICHINGSDWIVLAQLLGEWQEYRNLFIYRNRFRRIFCIWVMLWYRPVDTLYIQAKEIGGGLYIQHGFSTMISAESIGENCWINQQVTIGFNGSGRPPIIGDNVMITCGAKVLGSIKIGNNVVIAANAVVIRDVENGAVVGGVPARKLK